jgi:hypothetical protein
MRSDKLKAHHLTHLHLYDLRTKDLQRAFDTMKRKEELKQEAKSKKKREQELKQETKLKKIKEISHKDELSASLEVDAEKDGIMTSQPTSTQTLMDDETLRKDLLEGNQRFIAKIKFGGRISRIIDEEGIDKESLNKKQQEALLLFKRKQSSYYIN